MLVGRNQRYSAQFRRTSCTMPELREYACSGLLNRLIMPISEDIIREELKKVVDPELFVNIIDLGLVYEVTVNETPEGKSNISIQMTMTSPMCPAGPQMIGNSKQVLGAVEGVGEVEVKIVLDPPWTPDRMTEEARDQLGIF
jgi:metal-sulfur cluster biosynthetic enzyme